jgi:hypothetical protein
MGLNSYEFCFKPMVLPWGIRYRKDKASFRGAIVLRETLRNVKRFFWNFSLTTS